MVDFYTATEEAYKNGYKAGMKAFWDSMGDYMPGDKVLIQGMDYNEWHEGWIIGCAWPTGEEKKCAYVVKWEAGNKKFCMSVTSENHLRLVERS